MLVVAPSNVAVDNIMERIMDLGFIDGFTNRYNPAILRVGADKKNPRVRPVRFKHKFQKMILYRNSYIH